MVDLQACQTLKDLFLDRVAADPDATALLFRDTDRSGDALERPHAGPFTSVSWQQLHDEVIKAACGFLALGVESGDRVVQIANNRREWIVCDLALAIIAAVHVPLHASLSGRQMVHQIRHSGAQVVVIEDEAVWRTLSDVVPNGFDSDLATIALDADFDRTSEKASRVLSWESFRRGGRAKDREAIERAARNPPDAHTLATILYTSGTTGDAKGVLLSHGNLVSNTLGMLAALDMRRDDVRLSILPWSHVFARTCDLYTWIASGSTLAIGDGREHVLANCVELKPTLMNAVPYFYEKVHDGLVASGAHEKPGSLLAMLGGQVRVCYSGGAALPDHVFQLFQRQGVCLLQGYGLTETSPVITMSTPDENKMGCVGKPIRDVDVRIAEDGEIVTRGPHVMLGYYSDPQATEEVFRDGWFCTGDLGEIDDEGFLRITGRKKEMIVLATGKNIAPVAIESLLTQDPLICQAIVVGDNRKFLGALIVLHAEALRVASERLGIADRHPSKRQTDPALCDLLARRIAERLAPLSAAEQIGAIRLIEEEFTVESGMLTPSLKMCRPKITSHYSELIESMYQASTDL